MPNTMFRGENLPLQVCEPSQNTISHKLQVLVKQAREIKEISKDIEGSLFGYKPQGGEEHLEISCAENAIDYVREELGQITKALCEIRERL